MHDVRLPATGFHFVTGVREHHGARVDGGVRRRQLGHARIERIERLQAEEELAAVRPELDGNEIQAVLGIKPGPVLGRAYKHLLAVRLDEGVIGKDAASERLREWWAQQPESQG